jgi:transposase
MRGASDPKGVMFFAIDVEGLIRPDHPLRPIKRMMDQELAKMDALFDKAYSDTGRPSVPPEMLLKALLLQALYSVRSERALVERIATDLLFRWFVDMDPAQDVFDHSSFTHNRVRLSEHGLIGAFFDGVVKRAMDAGLCSDDHFSVDGTLIQSHASLKGLRPIETVKVERDAAKDKDGNDKNSSGGRNPSVNFRGQKRSNQTHQSPVDPEARLCRKGDGQPALLCHSGHALMENRNGLILQVAVDEANGLAEREQALAMLDAHYERHGVVPTTLGADKGYAAGSFLSDLVGRVVRPHVAMKDELIRATGDDADRRRTMRQRMKTIGYAISQRKRKLVEEAFGWIKTVAGLRRTKLVGRWKLRMQMQLSAAAYNLIRMRNLAAA